MIRLAESDVGVSLNLYLRAESLQAILSRTIPLSDRLGALKFTAEPADNETLADAFQVVLVLRSPSLDGEGPEQALRRVMGSLLTELGLSQDFFQFDPIDGKPFSRVMAMGEEWAGGVLPGCVSCLVFAAMGTVPGEHEEEQVADGAAWAAGLED